MSVLDVHFDGISQEMMQALDETGVFVVEDLTPTQDAGMEAALRIGQVLGANTFGAYMLQSEGSDRTLQSHVETIYLNSSEMVKYFALFGIERAITGGQTIVHDSRLLADRLLAEYPDMASVAVMYGRLHTYPDEATTHRLIHPDPQYGNVLRYQAKTNSNIGILGLPEGVSEEEYYQVLDHLIEDTDPIYCDAIKPGQMVVVNNHITIHGRASFVGRRSLLRVRYDDPNNQMFSIARSAGVQQ